VKGCFGGCLGRIAALVMLLVLVAMAWRFGPDLARQVGEELGRTQPPASTSSPEMADAALARYLEMADGDRSEVSLSDGEVESILRHRLPSGLPPGVHDPLVHFQGDEVRLTVRVERRALPSIAELETVLSVLPDTVSVQLRGPLITTGGSEAALILRRIDVSGVPVPGRFHGQIAEAIQFQRSPDLPSEAISFPLPPGIESIHLQAGRLILRAAS
jgi:hypothetical protein